MPLNSFTHKKYRTAMLLLWVTLVSNLLCLQTVSQAAQWTTETIDDPRYFFNMPAPFVSGQKISVAMDGSINILYGEITGDLLVAKKIPNGGIWQYVTVYKSSNTSGASFPSFAFDAQSRPHVTYTEQFNTGERNIQSAVLENNQWQVETVVHDVDTNCIHATTIAVDVLANEHVLYSASDSPEEYCRLLQYAYKNGGEWLYETIERNDFVSILPKAMVLDSNSSPHVIYVSSNGTNYELKYAFKTGGLWQTTVVSSDVDMMPSISIDLDNNDKPHICYQTGYPDNEMKYAFYDGLAWQIQDIGVSGLESSLVLDTNDKPHISFRGTNYSGLFYAFYDGVNWQITNIDTGDYVGMFNSITIDSLSNIHISYEGANWAMMHAWYDGKIWQKEKVDNSRRVFGESITIDNKGNPHISYSYIGTSEIQYAFYDGSAWQIQTVYTSENLGYNYPVIRTSLALDFQNNTHLAFTDSNNMNLKYGFYNASGWQFQTISSEGIVVSSPVSLALGANSKPHVVYFDETNKKIKYSYLLDNNNWVVEDINLPFEPTSYYELSLLFDRSSNPHLLYRIDTSLYYSKKTNSTWQTELVSNEVNSWSSGFALDKTSRPYVTYQDSNNYNFWYGYGDETGWHVEEIGIHGKYRGESSSLLFDKAGNPHISYSYNDYDPKEFYLKHAYFNDDAWQIDIVNSTTTPFGIDSVISHEGELYIGYADSGKKSLEYATALFPQPKFPWWSFWPTIMKAAQDRAKQ